MFLNLCFSPPYSHTIVPLQYTVLQSHDNVKGVACSHKRTADLGDTQKAANTVRKKTVVSGGKNAGVCRYLQDVHVLECVAL